ncbi:hypothetical protein FHT17_000840 [Novosphingobium sp. SG916]|nr:hypothetical protein [Novosphingobium sp. SG919]NMN85970.1 hypothetical protein [Novosphingobium sp. SG916]
MAHRPTMRAGRHRCGLKAPVSGLPRKAVPPACQARAAITGAGRIRDAGCTPD